MKKIGKIGWAFWRHDCVEANEILEGSGLDTMVNGNRENLIKKTKSIHVSAFIFPDPRNTT